MSGSDEDRKVLALPSPFNDIADSLDRPLVGPALQDVKDFIKFEKERYERQKQAGIIDGQDLPALNYRHQKMLAWTLREYLEQTGHGRLMDPITDESRAQIEEHYIPKIGSIQARIAFFSNLPQADNDNSDNEELDQLKWDLNELKCDYHQAREMKEWEWREECLAHETAKMMVSDLPRTEAERESVVNKMLKAAKEKFVKTLAKAHEAADSGDQKEADSLRNCALMEIMIRYNPRTAKGFDTFLDELVRKGTITFGERLQATGRDVSETGVHEPEP